MDKISYLQAHAMKSFIKREKPLRVLSLLVLFIFLCNQIGWSDYLSLPPGLGNITQEFNLSASDPLPKVIHIQTVHMNYKVQKKIENILDYLTKEAGVHLIALEGADVSIDPDRVFLIDDPDVRYKIADDLAKEGQVTGAELYAVKSTQQIRDKKLRIEGIENRALYQRNLSDLQYVVEHRESMLSILEDLQKRVENIESVILPREIQQILLHKRKLEINSEDLPAFFRFLDEKAVQFGIEATPEKYPALAKFFILEEMAKFVEKNELAVLEEWKSLKAEKSIDESTSLSTFLSLQEIDRLAYPKLGAYKSYSELMNEAHEFSHQAVEESERLEQEILYTLIIKKRELALVELEKDLSDIKQLFDMTLVRDRIGRIEERGGELRYAKLVERLEALETSADRTIEPRLEQSKQMELDALVTRSKSFYQLAKERDVAMMNRFSELLKPNERAVIITGGFHSDGITQLLKEKNISYSVILPDVEEINDHNAYLKAFSTAKNHEMNGSAETSHLELALTFGDVGFEPLKITTNRLDLLSAQMQTGMPIPFDQNKLGPLPERATSVTATFDDNAQTVKFVVTRAQKSPVEFSWSTETGLTLGDTTVSAETVASLISETTAVSRGFGAIAPKGSLLAVALATLMWCASCSTDFTLTHGGNGLRAEIPLLDTDYIDSELIINIIPLPDGAITNVDALARSLNENEIIRSVPLTADLGQVNDSIVNEEALDLIEPGQDENGNVRLVWDSPTNLADMRTGHFAKYVGTSIDISSTGIDEDIRSQDIDPNGFHYAVSIINPHQDTAEVNNVLGYLSEQFGNPFVQQLKKDGALQTVAKSVKQADGSFAHEEVRDAEGNIVKPFTLLDYLRNMGVDTEKLENGQAVPAIEFLIKVNDVKTFRKPPKKITLEVSFNTPLRAKINEQGVPSMNADGTFIPDHRPLATISQSFTITPGQEQKITVRLNPDLIKLPIRNIYVGVLLGEAFDEVDFNLDGSPDIRDEYPVSGDIDIRFRDSDFISAVPSISLIPMLKSGFGQAFDKADLSKFESGLIPSARAFAQALESFSNDAQKTPAGVLHKIAYTDPAGFGSIELSGIRNGIVTVKVSAVEKITRFLQVLGIVSAVGTAICGNGGCGTHQCNLPLPGPDGSSFNVPIQCPLPSTDLDDLDDLFPVSDNEAEGALGNEEEINAEPLLTVPLALLPNITPLSVVANSETQTLDGLPARPFAAPTTLHQGMFDPSSPANTPTQVKWGANNLGLSPELPDAKFVAIVLNSAQPAADGVQTFYDFLLSNIKAVRNNPALQDSEGNLIPQFQALVDSLENIVKQIQMTTDKDNPVFWNTKVKLDIPQDKKVLVTVQIKGRDPKTGDLTVTTSKTKSISGQKEETIRLRINREKLNNDFREMVMVLELGSRFNEDGTENNNYVSGGSLSLKTELELGRTLEPNEPAPVLPPSKVPSPLQIKDSEIRAHIPLALLELYRSAFRHPAEAPFFNVTKSDLNFGALDDFTVTGEIIPPVEGQPATQFAGFVWSPPPVGTVILDNSGVPIPPQRNLVGLLRRLVESTRISESEDFGGEEQKQAVIEQLGRIINDALEGYPVVIRAKIRVLPQPGQPKIHPVPISIKFEKRAGPPENPISIPVASAVFSVVPDTETTTVAFEIPEYVLRGDSDITQITATIEAGAETFINADGEEEINPNHIEQAKVEILGFEILSTEQPENERGFGISQNQSPLALNPRLGQSIAQLREQGADQNTIDQMAQTYLNGHGVATWLAPEILTDYVIAKEIHTPGETALSVPLRFGVLPLVETGSKIIEKVLQQKAGPDAKIGTFELRPATNVAAMANRNDARPLIIGNKTFYTSKSSDGLLTVTGSPEDLLALRARSQNAGGIVNGVRKMLDRLQNGLPQKSSVSFVPEHVQFADIFALMETDLTQAGALPSNNFFSQTQKGNENNFAVKVVTDLSAENFHQLELDIRENPSSIYIYLDYELKSDSAQAVYAQEIAAKYENFFYLRVDDGRRNTSGAAEYLSEFFTQSLFTHKLQEQERELFGRLLARSPYKTSPEILEKTFIVASPELVSTLNQHGAMQKTPKLILDRIGRTAEEITALHFVGLYFARLGFAEALKQEWLEAADDAIIYSTYRPTASFLSNLSALYSSYVTALKTLSVSA